MEPDLVAHTRRSPGARMFVALWGGLALVDLSRPGGSGLLTGALVTALVAVCGIGQSVPAAAAIAATGWLVINGFVLHRYGELGFGPGSWVLLAVVLGVVVLVASRTMYARDQA